MKKRFDVNDLLFVLGLILIGTGLFLWKGPGVSFTVTGALMFLTSFIAAR